jgi:hypothetical protein
MDRARTTLSCNEYEAPRTREKEVMRAIPGPTTASHPRAAATLLEGLALCEKAADVITADARTACVDALTQRSPAPPVYARSSPMKRRWLSVFMVPLALVGAQACSLTDVSGLSDDAPGAGGDAATDAPEAAAPSDAALDAAIPSDAGARGIVFRGVQQAGPLSGDTITIARPDVQGGDFLLIALFQYNSGAVVTGLDGWQVRAALDPYGADGVHGGHSLRIFSKVATELEPASFTVRLDAPNAGDVTSAILAAWGGTNPVIPVDVEKGISKDFPPFAAPSVATNFPEELLVVVTSTTYGSGASWTAPTGLTERAATGGLGLFVSPWPTAGSSGDLPYASSAKSNVGSGAVTMALRPR